VSNNDLDFHGIRVRLTGDSKVINLLIRDFAFFADRGGNPHIRLHLLRGDRGERLQRGVRWRDCRFSDRQGLRHIDYGDGALLYDFAAEHGEVRATTSELLHELSYLTILSRVGDILDQRGLHRVHALGFAYRGQGGLLLLPMKGGKTTLALEMLRRPDFQVLSDDIPLVDGRGYLRAMPLRLGVRGVPDGVPQQHLRSFKRRRFGPKTLVELDFFRHRVSREAPLRWIFAGKPASKIKPLIRHGSTAAALRSGLVLGLGTPQVLELLFPSPPRLRSAARLARTAFKRLQTARALRRQADNYTFSLGMDAAENVDVLEQVLHES
jgi:hypothetical protein